MSSSLYTEQSSVGDEIVNLVIKGEVFHCTKQCLISASDYFRAMFSGHFVESQKSSIEIQDVEPETLKKVLDFLNSGSLDIISNQITCLSVLQCASMLQFCRIEKLCEDHLLQELSFRNCLEVYEISSSINNARIAEAAFTFAMWSFEDIMDTEYYLNLSLQAVEDYLKKTELNVGLLGEWSVWEAILKWIQHNEDERKQYIVSLLQCLDFSQLTPDDIANIMFYDDVSSDPTATKLLEAAKSQKSSSLDITAAEVNCSGRSHVRKNRKKLGTVSRDVRPVVDSSGINQVEAFNMSPKRILPCVACLVCHRRGQAKEGGSLPVVYYYDHVSGTVEQLVQLSKLDPTYNMCVGFRACAVGPSIYISGGQYLIGGNKWNMDVWSYNYVRNKWLPQSTLPQPRRGHMTAVLGSIIYLVGGYGKHRINLNSVDAYDIVTGSWLQLGSTPFLGDGAVCTFKNRILVFINRALYTYFPERDSWVPSELESKHHISYSSAVSFKDWVYLLGTHSKVIFRMRPETSWLVEQYGSFSHITSNICLVPPYLISFATTTKTADGLDDSSSEVNIIESLVLEDSCDGQQLPPKLSQTIWKERLKDGFTSQIISSYNELPYGCFSLFKVRRN